MSEGILLGKIGKIKGIGIILLVLALGVLLLTAGGGDEKTVPTDAAAEYARQAEARLAELGKRLCGVSCVAAVSLDGGYRYSYACDQTVTVSYNPDGTVADRETVLTNRTVSSGGSTTLVPVKTATPRISGVAIVCKGASLGDAERLRQLVAALYSLDGSEIFVTN